MGGSGGLGQALGSIGGGLVSVAGGPLGMAAGASAGNKAAGGTGNVGDILGTSNNFQAQSAGLVAPTSVGMVTDQYGNAQNALAAQTAFANAAGAQNGLANQGQAFQMAQNTANGVGANPAMAQLQQGTATNTANQAALMAGQRGAGANSGLIARQAAMQGGANQQQMVGQAATMQAQQQIAAQQQMAQIAQQQVAQQQTALQGQGVQAQSLYGQVSSNINGQNSNALGNAQQMNTINSASATANATRNAQMIGGALSAGGSAMTMFSPGAKKKAATTDTETPAFAKGGAVAPSGARSSLHKSLNMQAGGPVPGDAKKPGDSPSNDTVHALLSPGEIVIPRSVLQQKNPDEAAKKFVAAILAKQGKV